MKDSFILFTEYKEQIEMLSDEQAGVLMKAIFCYASDEKLPEMDELTKMAFSFIKAKCLSRVQSTALCFVAAKAITAS